MQFYIILITLFLRRFYMETSTILAILKIIVIFAFVAIVTIVGTMPLRLATFKTNIFLKSMGTTFAGALFINVCLLHILP